MKYLSILALVLLFTTSSCKEDLDAVGVTLQLNATYDGTPLVMMEPYTYEDGLAIFFTKFKFYVSDIALIKDAGERVVLSEIEVVNFTSSDLASAEEGVQFSFSDIPVGEYTGIEMGIGVASALNESQPIDYPSTHPLNDVGDYWSAWESYIFTKIEGKVDVQQDGTFEQGVTYHIGSDELFRTINFNQALTIKGGDTILPNIELDLKKILTRSSSDYLDMEANTAVHNDILLMEYLMDNFSQAIEIQ